MPLYPTEAIIWDENIVPMEFFTGEGCLALPKLNLQFLTLHDYLLRNFNLFRLESTCEFIYMYYCTVVLLCRSHVAGVRLFRIISHMNVIRHQC